MPNHFEPRKYDIWDQHDFKGLTEEQQWIEGYLKEEIKSNFPDFIGIVYFSVYWVEISIYLLVNKIRGK